VRVQVERSGGFAGRTVCWAVDTDDLPPAAGEELRALVAAAPAWAGGSAGGAGPAGGAVADGSAAGGPVAGAAAGGPAAGGPAAGAAAGAADRFGYRLRATDHGSDGAGELDLRFTEPASPEAQRLLELVRDV